jgi:prefoldin subunit 5
LAFQEVFHEGLSVLDRETLLDMHPGAWNSHHPSSAPYFLEYAPLLAQGRLSCDEQMAYGSFMPAAPDRSITEVEALHIDRLISLARTLGKTPVLTAVRSLGRVHGLRQRFGGFHILLHRNLFRQWCSYTSQELHGNSYFASRTDLIIERNLHDPYLALISRMFPSSTGGMRCTRWHDLVRFALLHLYLLSLAHSDCDLEVSVDRLSSSPEYRADISGRIGMATGVPLDLEDCRATIEFPAFPMDHVNEILETIRIMAAEIPAFVPSWNEQQEEFLLAQVDALEDELDRSLFYTRALLRFSRGGFSDIAESRKAADSHSEVMRERDTLRDEICELERRLSDSAQQIGELRHEVQEGQTRLHQSRAESREAGAVADAARSRTRVVQAELAEVREREQALEAQLGLLHAGEREMQAENRRLQQAITDLRRSTSWRITRPIRMLKTAFGLRRADLAGDPPVAVGITRDT